MELATFPELHARYVPFTDCAPGWLQENLARAARAWVSADSVAMIYEALSAAARVAIIDVPIRRHDRISAVAGELRARGWVGSLDKDVVEPPPVLNEAMRCADLLLARWPDLPGGRYPKACRLSQILRDSIPDQTMGFVCAGPKRRF